MALKKGIHLINDPSAFKSVGLSTYQRMLGELGFKGWMNFAYADADGVLIPTLNLMENILIDSVPISLYREQHFSLEQFLESKGNPHLLSLYKSMHDPKAMPEHGLVQDCKLAALIKILLRDSHYLLLDFPERHLNASQRELFLQALEFNIKRASQCCFVATNEMLSWRGRANWLVIKDDNHPWSMIPAPAVQLANHFLPETDAGEIEPMIVKKVS